MSSFTSTASSSLSIADLFSVQGKNVLITGGGRGIGLMLTEAFVRNGAHVIIASRDASALQSVSSSLSALGPGTCTAAAADLSNMQGIKTLVSTLADTLNISQLHILINNSGASWGESLSSFPEKGWDKVMDLNVKSLFFLTQALLPLLTAAASSNDPARIIMIGSVAGIRHQAVASWSYDVSKAAVHHLTKKLAEELASKHTTVNCIAPGYVPTKMSKSLPVSMEDIGSHLPLGRVGCSEDIAGIGLYLGSKASAWVTGAIIPVDGGWLTMSKL